MIKANELMKIADKKHADFETKYKTVIDNELEKISKEIKSAAENGQYLHTYTVSYNAVKVVESPTLLVLAIMKKLEQWEYCCDFGDPDDSDEEEEGEPYCIDICWSGHSEGDEEPHYESDFSKSN